MSLFLLLTAESRGVVYVSFSAINIYSKFERLLLLRNAHGGVCAGFQ